MIYSLGQKKPEFNSDEVWIADSADLIGEVILSNDVSIWFNVTIRADNDVISIGSGSNIQDNTVIHTDEGIKVNIGENVTVGHKVIIHGASVGDNTVVGMGSVVMNHARIGKNCIIGAKALITENKVIPDNSLVVGSPGKVIREVSEEEKKAVFENTKHYQDNWKKYSKSVF